MNNSELQLSIVSAEKKLFTGSVTSIIVPGISGKFGVYPGHAPLISPLQAGIVVYNVNGKEETLEVQGGMMEVKGNEVTICVI